MSTSIQNKWAKDPRCVLLLHMDGDNNGTTFVDHSPSRKMVTVNGDAKTVTATKRFGNASAYFDGTGDYLSTSTASDWTFLHNGSLWTISVWIKVTTFMEEGCLFDTDGASSGNKGFRVVLNNTRTFTIMMNPTLLSGTTTYTFPNDTNWHHLVITYDHNLASSNLKIYVDGIFVEGITKSGAVSSIDPAYPLNIGAWNVYTKYFNGYLDDLIIYKDVVIPIEKLYPQRAPLYDYAVVAPQGV